MSAVPSPPLFHHRLVVWMSGILVFTFSLLPLSTHAQRLPIGEAITMEDGLGFRDVSAVTQDVSGLMWFGTRQGLNRYDGYRFLRFGNDARADVRLPADDILYGSIHFLNDTILWLVADRKLYALDTRHFTYEDLNLHYQIKGEVTFLKKSIDGSMWVVWESGEDQFLWRIDPRTGAKSIAREQRGRREFTCIATDTSGNAWWSTIHGGLKQYAPSGEMQFAFKPDSFNWFGTTMYYTPLFIDSKNRMFIVPKSQQAFWLYHPETHHMEIVADHLSSVGFYTAEDRLGNVWFTTKNELFRFDPQGVLTDVTGVLQKALSFSTIQALYEDQANLMWVATDNGLVKFPNFKQLFENHFDVPDMEWGNSMRGIFDDSEGRIYAYCESGQVGLHRFDPRNHQTDFIFLPDPVQQQRTILGEPRHFISDHQDDAVWTVTDALVKIDLHDIHPYTQPGTQNISRQYARNPLTRLSNGQFLFGSSLKHIAHFDPDSEKVTPVMMELPSEAEDNDINCFVEAPDHTYWIGTLNQGLYHIATTGKIIKHYQQSARGSLSVNNVLSLYMEGDSILWIGTFGGGLNRLDIHDQTITVFTTREGLANDNVTSILADDAGNIWSATYHGLSCYLRQEGIFRNYYEEDGLSNNEFNYASSFRDHDGHMWFGGMNGVQTFDPAEIIHQQVNPPLTWTGLLKYNRRIDSLQVLMLGDTLLDAVRVSPYDSYVQFSWTLPNYFKPDQNKYYVWLEGLEEGWTYIGNQPLIRYHKLPAGDYTLHIKGADSKGNWSSTQLSIPLIVNPLFFKTWWFILLSILGMGGLIYAFVRYRYRRLLEMEKMRTRIAGDLHDEVGSMLSGLAMQAEIMEMNPSKADPAKLKRLTELSRMTLSKMRDVVWSIDSRRDRVKDLVDRMRENAEEMLTPRDIRFHLELGDLPLDKKLKVDTRQHVFLFFKEAITNIVKHSKADQVTIRFGYFPNGFELTIADNGSPSTDGPPSSGMGLQNMEMRAQKLHGTFLVSRNQGFSVSLFLDAL